MYLHSNEIIRFRKETFLKHSYFKLKYFQINALDRFIMYMKSYELFGHCNKDNPNKRDFVTRSF